MRDYKQNNSETQIDKRAFVGYVSGYDPDESGNAEQDEVAGTMPNSGSKENILSALTEPEDWERGYD
ncbi:MAG TPA: hypothetical protein VLU73_02955 [Methylococcaceae bacterium]|jgi:hypothetical protein|nr:hypothetical protein [Methylococcaceae bacterium]